MRDLTFICAYYLNPGMLLEQQRTWASYPPELKARLHTIVCDDGSPRSPARDVFAPVGLASQRLYRTGVDIRWNWLFCRNLGASVATTDWLLLTDIDHLMPASTLRTILSMELDASAVYRLSRVDAPHPMPYDSGGETCGTCRALWTSQQAVLPKAERREYPGRHIVAPYKPHPNTWLLTRAMFDRIGGYDERFSGYYGSDSEFRERVHREASAIVMLPDPLVRYPREIIPDASTTTYERKAKEDAINVPRIKAEREKIKHWRPLRVTFPYTLERQAFGAQAPAIGAARC